MEEEESKFVSSENPNSPGDELKME